jgi:hypothetical protein
MFRATEREIRRFAVDDDVGLPVGIQIRRPAACREPLNFGQVAVFLVDEEAHALSVRGVN